MEAVGQSDCSIYGEDTVTDEEGKFRLRGLLVSLSMCFVSGFFHTGFSGAWVQWCPQDARNEGKRVERGRGALKLPNPCLN